MRVSTESPPPGGKAKVGGIVRSNMYYMLVSSLPALPPRLDVDRLPITLERLQARLRMLEPEDAQEISRMLDILGLAWSRPVRGGQ